MPWKTLRKDSDVQLGESESAIQPRSSRGSGCMSGTRCPGSAPSRGHGRRASLQRPMVHRDGRVHSNHLAERTWRHSRPASSHTSSGARSGANTFGAFRDSLDTRRGSGLASEPSALGHGSGRVPSRHGMGGSTDTARQVDPEQSGRFRVVSPHGTRRMFSQMKRNREV